MSNTYLNGAVPTQPSPLQPVPNLTIVSSSPNTAIVRVVETRVLQKQSLRDLEDTDEDPLIEAYTDIVTEAAGKLVMKELAEAFAGIDDNGDIDPPVCDDPEIIAVAESFAGDEESESDDENAARMLLRGNKDLPGDSESLMQNDDDDYFSDEPTPVSDEAEEAMELLSEVSEEIDECTSPYITQANEENMKDEPYKKTKLGNRTEAWGIPNTDEEMKESLGGSDFQRLPLIAPKPAPDKLDFLKSVEGRVLTVLEAALPDKEHRNAVKTLIRKEFRREMNRVSRPTSAENDED